jgi:hypothetical protein
MKKSIYALALLAVVGAIGFVISINFVSRISGWRPNYNSGGYADANRRSKEKLLQEAGVQLPINSVLVNYKKTDKGFLINLITDDAAVGPPTGKPVAPHVNSIQTSFDLNPGAVAIARI